MLSRDEPEEISVADIVSLTHIGRNTFYGHFEDVGQATAEVARGCLEEVEQALAAAAPRQATPHAALQTFIDEWFGFVERRPASVRIALRSSGDLFRARLEGALLELHRVGQSAGVFRRVLEPERLWVLGSALVEASAAVAKGRARSSVSAAAMVDAVLALCR